MLKPHRASRTTKACYIFGVGVSRKSRTVGGYGGGWMQNFNRYQLENTLPNIVGSIHYVEISL